MNVGSALAAEHAHAADRFAREIGGILTLLPARSRRLMGRPFGGSFVLTHSSSTFCTVSLYQSNIDNHTTSTHPTQTYII